MSTPMAETTKSRRSRRRFDDDFKAQAVRLVLDEGKSVGAVARDLDLTETALREWVKRARADCTKGRTGLTRIIKPSSCISRITRFRLTRSFCSIRSSWIRGLPYRCLLAANDARTNTRSCRSR